MSDTMATPVDDGKAAKRMMVLAKRVGAWVLASLVWLGSLIVLMCAIPMLALTMIASVGSLASQVSIPHQALLIVFGVAYASVASWFSVFWYQWVNRLVRRIVCCR